MGKIVVSAVILSVVVMVLCEMSCGDEYFTNQWAVHVEGGEDVARRLADKHGFTFVDTIMPDYYHFQHRKVSKRSLGSSSHVHRLLVEEPEVKWLEQQISKKRIKRDAAAHLFNDEKWPKMWYLHRDGGLDMNVAAAYQRWGVTGRGTVVSILDDGIEKDHPDLVKNYDAGGSYDVNGHDPDPQPRYDVTNENRHGTRCAGEVSAQANNGICSAGVAYEAGIGGVRMLDGDVTDAVEAQSIGLNPQHIDIYSASWGPDDDGRTVDGPGVLAKKAFLDGITKGRGGLGSIYVWASGNGGRNGDSCSCDGYTNSIYTLSISSASENGYVPWYSEPCASTLATTYSSGSSSERQILTTDLRHLCTESHTGTSASAPLAGGICALALHANPQLTWRDMQHIVVMTARMVNLQADDWVVNGIGRKVSHHFGFGMMDAAAMVELAMNWTRVPDQHRCQVASTAQPRSLGPNSAADLVIQTDGCADTSDVVRSLEHVQIVVTLSASQRGKVELSLTSPSGTRQILLARRHVDVSAQGLNGWALMTVHCWGEDARGNWTLTVSTTSTSAQLTSWSLILFGTASPPRYLAEYLASRFPTAGHTVDMMQTLRPTPVAGFFTAVTDTFSSNSSTEPTSANIVLCQPGRYLLNGVCYTDCPLTYYPTNVTSVSLTDRGQPVAVTGICSRCNSVGVCTDLLRLLLTVVGIVASIAITVVVFACLRGVCRRPATNRSIGGIAAARLHSARYITNGHIIAGLSTRPLLAASDTDSSDESETPCDSAIVNNI